MIRDGEGKLLSLDTAISRYVEPGMNLHLAAGIGGPSAAICEIIRQHSGKNPAFTLIQSTLTGHGLNLVHMGLVKKLICAVCADISASARPSRVVQKAQESGRIELENWSLNSLQQRLMAAAFGVPFMATRSVRGSSIASDNTGSFTEIRDPFGSETPVGVVRALHPDISIIHGCVADLEGNVILAAPYGEDLWGALASREGVLVTVEKIVSTDFIRKYGALVKIPGHLVKAVCVAPLGLHPFSLANPGVDGIDPYEKDTEFLNALHGAFETDELLDGWIREWVLEPGDHEQYLKKLGADRVRSLKAKAGGNPLEVGGWRLEAVASSLPLEVGGWRLEAVASSLKRSDPQTAYPTGKEMMLIALAREIEAAVVRSGHKLILAGAGNGATAAFFAYFMLKEKGQEIELVTGNGQIGYTPVPGESILASEAGVRTCKMLTDTVMTQGVFVGGANNRCLSVLGAGQMDRYGNINSTKTSKGRFLVGSGGANDALNAREVIICLDQSKDRFAGSLAYVTGLGSHVTRVVSTMGVFAKSGEEELSLSACFPGKNGESLEQRIKEIEDLCGWPLKRAPRVEEMAEPTEGELKLLRWLVPA